MRKIVVAVVLALACAPGAFAQSTPPSASTAATSGNSATLLCSPKSSPCAPVGMMHDAYEIALGDSAVAGATCNDPRTKAVLQSVFAAVYGGSAADWKITGGAMDEEKYPNGYACNPIADNDMFGAVENLAVMLEYATGSTTRFNAAAAFSGFWDQASVMASGTPAGAKTTRKP